jgi:sigma-B regulation protein RsbU (phosphoserine phosphatase)
LKPCSWPGRDQRNAESRLYEPPQEPFMPIALDNLKESNEFLNLILENINSAILIADENMRIHQFNKSFLSLFDHAADRVIESSFGQISGCVNAVKENKACGGTSQCQFCVLRKTLLQTLVKDYPVDRKAMERIFYIKGIPVLKNLEVTSRLIQYHGQKMILVIIYDVSEIEEQKKKLEKQQQFRRCFRPGRKAIACRRQADSLYRRLD